ncbi:glycosyltransferase [Pararhodonellum marinum]|uniref:glycosyltransferase n=1 Tax=Pararhodonellum marinum TaxID=2755358 RepID=UPI00188E3F90|nr:glycosyltransferase [Pararhodonellum marinum]
MQLLYKIFFLDLDSKSLFRRGLIRVINLWIPIYYKATSWLKGNRLNKDFSSKNNLTIVSLTTFPSRIEKVWLTIESILRQAEQPDKILLWLYKGEFDGLQSLPENLLKLQTRGLQICFCDENLKPHKKYFYTLKNFPEATLITIDDDVIYPPDLIAKLKSFYKKYPQSIICTVTRKIEISENQVSQYNDWKYEKSNSKPSFLNLIVGVGGTLYPPNSLHDEVLNLENLKKIALTADDLWLKVMSLKKMTKVVSIAGEYPGFFIPILFKDKYKLADENVNKGANNLIFKKLFDFYNIDLKIFKNID